MRAPKTLRTLLAAAAALGALLACHVPVSADAATSSTFSIDLDGYFYRTQDAYLPSLTMTDLKLSGPSDIFCLGDTLYIADPGNKRIVLYDIRLDTSRDLTYDGFVAPSGVHVTEQGAVYVADPEAQAVFEFDRQFAFVRVYERPTDPTFASTVPFRPKRVGVDRRGSLYIVIDGFGDGIVQLDGEGTFLGYFASNKTSVTLVQRMQDLLFTEEIKKKLFPRVPPVFSSLYVDAATGLVYSTTFNDQGHGLKKHNIAGKNMLGSVWDSQNPVDVAVDATGKMFVAYEDGWIDVFSDDGRLLFFFGGQTTTGDFAGIFTKLSAIAVDGLGNLWTVDGSKNYLQRFTPTDYSLGIFAALDAYNTGDYDGSLAAWRSVLSKNEMSSLAHAGIAKVDLLRQNYATAAREFAIAGDRTSYSEAYWEVRNAYIQRTAATWILLLLGFFVALAVLRRVLRGTKAEAAFQGASRTVRGLPFVRDVLYAGHVMAHPSDAFYELRLGHKGSLPAALFFLFLGYAAYLYDSVGRGYIFQKGRPEDANLVLISFAFFFLLALFIVGNTLVASINEGNGRLVTVLKMTGYALVPAALLFPAATLLSNVLTLNETYLFTMVQAAALVWTFATLSVGVAETHEYLYRNSIKSLLVTVFFMLIAILSLSILAILGGRVIDFVASIVKEVAGRA
jgi:sugar lactone lactonase YvrE